MMTTEELLRRYFHIEGHATINPSTGLVDVDGNAHLRSIIRVLELPVKFGNVSGNFMCYQNQLQSLAGSPQSGVKDFFCGYNNLTSLIGATQSVTGYFDCRQNQLKALTGAPHTVKGMFKCSDNPLESLDGLPKIVEGYIFLSWQPSLPLLKLFTMKKSTKVVFWINDQFQQTPAAQEVQSIINQYLPLGMKGMLPCAAELLKAGYKDNARL